MNPIRILVVDDHQIIRSGLASLLCIEEDMKVVGFASNGIEAIEKARELLPDVIIMDIIMPRMDGVDATKEIIKRFPMMRILLLTTYGSTNGIARAIEAGAIGAIMKNADDSQLAKAVRQVAANKRTIAKDILEMLENEPTIPELSSRQEEILKFLVDGYENKQIASKLNLSIPTINDYVNKLLSKLHAANRTEAVAIALRKHLLKI